MWTALAALAGCASMSEQQCLEGDWAGRGLSDGKEGRNPEYRLEAHAKACENVRVVPNRAAYMEGWRQGISKYCTPEGAFEAGRKGNSPSPELCPPGMAALFTDNYRLGHEVHQLDAEISALESQISKAEYELKKKKDISPEERGHLLRTIEDLRWQLLGLRSSRISAESRPLIRAR